MSCTAILKARVLPEIKLQAKVIADREMLTEAAWLKRLVMNEFSIGELASIGRKISQIAKLANEGGRLPGSVREEFRAMLKICEALRESTKALLKANVVSWRTGHVEANL
jgi:hypothetical protein